MMTSIKGVFAAGDIVRGASLVVWGIKDGRDAALSIDKYIIPDTIMRGNITKYVEITELFSSNWMIHDG